ncbi:short-chain dehydrogenase domain protein [Mycobacterium kansasii]|uniref:Short-chain dehydrogenase domain protein n=1 Tax=Mycobacterium kansasii TaxID=1768 RepID=A0A1V3XX28_MYCKA|nr:short-chain dehydrogenase domain protein [Mycobacterium kansasii]
MTPALQRFTGSIPAEGRVVPIEGSHWVVTSRPDVIARLTGEWVDMITEGVARRVSPPNRALCQAHSRWSPGRVPGSAGPPQWSWPVRVRMPW